jgi:signal transduction histidine kinase
MPSLRGKILTTYAFSKAVLLVFAGAVFADLYYLQTQILDGEAVHAFRESSQEIRREEKNLFLYYETGNLNKLMRHLDAAETSFRTGQNVFAGIADAQELSSAVRLLRLYRSQLQRYSALGVHARAKEQLLIRNTGRDLSDLAQDFSERERAVLAQSVRTASWILLTVFLTVLLLGIGSALFLVRQVARPLREVEHQLDELTEGHDQHLTLPSKDQEIRSFVHHFNTMLNRLRAQQTQLRHHEKAAALGVLVSGVAHELNNPLSNISTSVQLLLEADGSADPALHTQWLSHIDGESERARRIVRRLLDSVRQPKLHLQAHNVDELIKASLALVSRQLPKTVTVNITAAPTCVLRADRERMHQVLINLIKNAADAGATHIDVMASESNWMSSKPVNTDHLFGEITPVSQAEHVLRVIIEDDGPGIAPEHLGQIFNPFFTTHSTGDGTGLGLYLVEEIISEHHGCIAVENRAEGGTRFTLWLPLPHAQEAT